MQGHIQESQFILIATSKALLKVDLQAEKIDIIDEEYGLYGGVTWDSEYYYVAARWYASWMPTSMIERPRLLVFDKTLTLVGCQEYPAEAKGLHQILYYNGSLYCPCAKEDSVLIRTGESWSVWYPSPDPTHHNRNVHHFNSIWIHKDHLYLVAHNGGPSEIWEFTYPQRELLVRHRIGNCVHNVWQEDEDLAVCNSGNGTIDTQQGRVLCQTGYFPRGVVKGPDVNVVGLSMSAIRLTRWKTRGRVRVYTKDWQLLKEVSLGKCGQIVDIRSLGPDLSHNGLPPPE